MKKALLLLIVMLFVVFPVCAGDLADVREAGVLRMGVSPDRWPFAFYDQNDDLTGIDIRLMEEIVSRMGLKLEVTEMAPEDLAESLELRQIDLAGGAFSRLDSRKALIDHSSIYYSTFGIFVMKSDAGFGGPDGSSPLTGKKIGTLKNSSFEEWLKDDLTDAGETALKDIFTYSRIEDAMKALDRKKIDLVLLDTNLYNALFKGDYAAFEYEKVKDNYAFGMRKSSDLRAEINKYLAAILKDGTAQVIADTFFNDIPDEEQPVIQWTVKEPTPTEPAAPISFIFPTPAATSVPAVLPTAAPVILPTAAPTVPPVVFPTVPAAVVPTAAPSAGKCTYAMSYVADVTIPDGQQINGGSAFTKTWRIKNTGTCNWTTDFTISFVSGSQMNGTTRKIPRNVYPGDTVDLSVELTAPTAPGTYRGYWQIKTPNNYSVGPAIWVQIKVPSGETEPTPYVYSYPTEPPFYWPPVPTAIPTDSYGYTYTEEEYWAQKPRIESYYPNAYTNKSGQCVTLYWNVTNAGTVELIVDGNSFYFGSPGTGMASVCDEVSAVGAHYLTLCGYNAGGMETCETVLYTTIP